MIRRNFAWRSVAVLGVAAVALGACSDDGDGGTDDDTAAATCEGEDLHIGTILPRTGSLAFLGPPEFAAVDVAINEINAAGGVLGACVKVTHTDSGDTETDIASQSADALIQQGVHAVVGAASSGVSFQFIDKLYDEQIVQVSPANTSPDFTDYPKGDYYFRTAPSDVMQGRVLANQIVEDGHATVSILALQDAYGTGLAQYTREGLEEAGAEVVSERIYDPNAAEFSSEVAEIAEADPDAIVLITFDEFLRIAPELANAGLGPDVKQWYLVDGNLSNYGDQFEPGFLEGVKGTTPGVDPAPLRDRMLEVNPDLNDYTYGPESYDAVILIALAAEAAGTTDSAAIRDEMVGVSRDGTKCTSFAECKELIAAGEDIDYDGVSGPIEWDEVGDLTAATIGIYQYGPDNRYTNIGYRELSLE